MSFFQDKQIRTYCGFLVFWIFLVLSAGILFAAGQVNDVKAMYFSHDEAAASFLLEQGVPKAVIAEALTNEKISEAGRALLTAAGTGRQAKTRMLPFIYQFQQDTLSVLLIFAVLLLAVLAGGTFLFVWHRKRLYLQAEKVLTDYLDGDYSGRLPKNGEGAIYRIFALADQLATMLQSQKEAEHRTKEFLRDTISDISHQLKTPLAALSMYQEIMEEEPDNTETVKEFSAKMGISLNRMEQLIQSMLKITRLDAGNIVFEKSCCKVTELLSRSVSELMTRAREEGKRIWMDGDPDQQLVCDPAWTGEAVGNIVKNALDHTETGGTIHITWERTPAMLRITIADDGSGIAPEDIHHIFKRFYRSRRSSDTQGIGLGLSLAKAIIEGQKGVLSVRSTSGEGSAFTISFLTES